MVVKKSSTVSVLPVRLQADHDCSFPGITHDRKDLLLHSTCTENISVWDLGKKVFSIAGYLVVPHFRFQIVIPAQKRLCLHLRILKKKKWESVGSQESQGTAGPISSTHDTN